MSIFHSVFVLVTLKIYSWSLCNMDIAIDAEMVSIYYHSECICVSMNHETATKAGKKWAVLSI